MMPFYYDKIRKCIVKHDRIGSKYFKKGEIKVGVYLAFDTIDMFSQLFIALFVVVLLSVFAIINFKKRSDAEQELRNVKRKLEQSYMELGETYQQVKMTQRELAGRYEELKKSEERNKKLAYTDYVTNLPNRTAFSVKLDELLGELETDETAAVMYIDLDNFKNINDILGHSYGDELLIDVAGRIQKTLTEEDFIARFGGDEFSICTRHVKSRSSYENKIQKIYEEFSRPFTLSAREFFMTFSMGIVLIPKDGDSTQIVMKNVDAAMYAAKSIGKNTYYFYDASLNYNLMMKVQLQSELRKAIQNQEFIVYYQAQVDLKEERIAGFEALLRWKHPTKGLIVPDKFVQAAEETGQIVEIGKWVLYEACSQLRKWNEKGFTNINVAVNLSARQFKDVNLVQMVEDAIKKNCIDAHHLELEITESIALENIKYSIEVIEKLKEIGVQFSLDDFGTGYSSMNYLKYLPVNHLKIDKSFLDTVLENRRDKKIVSAIISLAQTLDLDVIAEGIENAEQVDFLKGVNCNKAQGYLYSKPIPAEQVDCILEVLKKCGMDSDFSLKDVFDSVKNQGK